MLKILFVGDGMLVGDGKREKRELVIEGGKTI
jgi:hypothetical protein